MRTALVTGGSRGIGLGCARALAEAGYGVAINGLRPAPAVADVLAELRAAGAPAAIYCPGDVGDEADRQRVLDAVRGAFGCLHVLVNNAGIAPTERTDVLDTGLDSFRRLLRINCEGPYFLAQAVARWLIEQKRQDPACRGCIVNINSISATVVSTNRGEYCVSKAGLAMVTQLFAARLGEHDLPVFEVRPGLTRTDMTAGVAAKYDALIDNGLCVTPRWGLPADTGKVVVALASGAFAYSTGQVVHVDGGLTIPRL
jgi:NAD(P)-dependent dehydrogenase (short-subunit alcohol dehydrogenase family)